MLVKGQATSKNGKKKFKLSDMLDNVIDQMEIDAKLQSKHMVYHHFSADDMKGLMTVKNNTVALNNFSMKAFGGGVKISGSIMNPYSSEPPRVQIEGKVDNADVHSVFLFLQ